MHLRVCYRQPKTKCSETGRVRSDRTQQKDPETGTEVCFADSLASLSLLRWNLNATKETPMLFSPLTSLALFSCRLVNKPSRLPVLIHWGISPPTTPDPLLLPLHAGGSPLCCVCLFLRKSQQHSHQIKTVPALCSSPLVNLSQEKKVLFRECVFHLDESALTGRSD